LVALNLLLIAVPNAFTAVRMAMPMPAAISAQGACQRPDEVSQRLLRQKNPYRRQDLRLFGSLPELVASTDQRAAGHTHPRTI
jgi:hypothetical protein